MALEIIQHKILKKGDQKLRPDFNLANLWRCKATVLSQAVKKNSYWCGHATTEQGKTALASVPGNGFAGKINMAIVTAFIALRKFVIQYDDLLKQIKKVHNRVCNDDKQLSQIFFDTLQISRIKK